MVSVLLNEFFYGLEIATALFFIGKLFCCAVFGLWLIYGCLTIQTHMPYNAIVELSMFESETLSKVGGQQS